MQDENQSTETDATTEQDDNSVQNVKAEMGRKFDNVKAELEAQNQKFEQLIQHIQTLAPQKAIASEQKQTAPDPISEPEAYANYVAAKTSEVVNKQTTRQQEFNHRIGTMTQQFPEFGDVNSEESKAVLNEYKNIPEHMKGTAEGAELAMTRVVARMGLQPVSKRQRSQREQEDFSLSGTGSNKRTGKKGSDDHEVSEETKEWSRLLNESLGLDPNDPKRQERLKQASKRTNWNRYSK